ncbi:LuxR C-terminal-related transcriptional regulator [Streptomyces sp. NBC_01351]|uniref:LuxR C-terminal-related transcriptional regulator n=1 Tax=Streptomyces sp. NBC_01351 TaxID=2903833 RepID=UPI002E3554E5|nr:LuxR C-terminal-related transcriptional regulator [Streptomyces sp. NBC_01351]
MNPDQSPQHSHKCDISRVDEPCSEALAQYRRALGTGTLPASEVSPCLWELHLVAELPDSPELVRLIPPEIAAHAVLRPLEDAFLARGREIDSTKAVFSAFTEAWAGARRDEEPPLTYLDGGELISRALRMAVDACETELLTAQPGGGRAQHLLQEALERDLRLLDRGVRQRTIYQHTVRSHQPTMSYIEQIGNAGAEVRTLTEVFDRMIICDRKVAFIPVTVPRANSALRIYDPGLVRFLAQFFDNAWDRSTPIVDGGSPLRSPTVTSDIQRAILRAVVGGETDDSIARRLGMSRRSVAEHVRRISVQLGSNSRAQLGYLLATSGLMEDPEEEATAVV